MTTKVFGDLRWVATVAVGIALGATACTAAQDDGFETTDSTSDAIVNGSVASSFPEAALIDAQDFICSGSVIAPRVALTAGHCVVGANQWRITTPFAHGQTALGHQAATSYSSTGETVNPNTVDVAVIILDTPINLTTYPKLATSKVADGTKGINVGRIRNGQASFSRLFSGTAVALLDARTRGFPFDYVSQDVIESGDSGGPVYAGTGATRKIIAVNSGAGGGTQLLARVDLVAAGIQSIIDANP